MENLKVNLWQSAGPFLCSHPRQNTGVDELLKYGGEAEIIPDPNQVFFAEQPPCGEIRWKTIETQHNEIPISYPEIDWTSPVNEFGWLERVHYSYAWTSVTVEEPLQVLIHSSGILCFYLNGDRYDGEKWAFKNNAIPVSLKKGDNRILVRTQPLMRNPSGSFTFCIVPTSMEITILEDLYETPDIVAGQVLKKTYAAVPVVNCSEHWIRNAQIHIPGDSNFSPFMLELPPLAPQTTIKIPFQISMHTPVSHKKIGEIHPLSLRIERDNETLFAMQLPFRIKDIKEPHKLTYLSECDGSVQYFVLTYPKNYNPEKQYALRVYLHGGGDIAAETMYIISPKEWAFILAPTNRRPGGWEWWDFARSNIFESMDYTIKTFPVDENRIYLTGASNGGQGTWYNGLRSPSQFAALAPNCAWSSYNHHAPRFWDHSDIFAPPELLYFRDRMTHEFNNPAFVENAGNLPVIASQGAEDIVVSPMNQRLFRKISEMHGNEIIYREIPGKPHAWVEPLTEDGGGDFFDHPEINDFMMQKSLNHYPSSVKIRLCDLSVNNTFYWIRILEQHKIYSDTRLEAQVDDNSIRITSSNVKSIELDLDPLLISGSSVQIEWNGKDIIVDLNQTRTVCLGKTELNGSEGLRKTGKLCGPLKTAFFSPYILVPGTIGTETENEILLHNARIMAQRCWRIANGYTKIVLDRDVSDEMISENNLILFGAPERNSLTEKIAKSTNTAETFPFQISKSAITIGKRRLEGSLSLEVVYPNPVNPKRLMALFAGTTSSAERLSIYFNPLHPGEPVPDFIVYSEEVKKYHWGGVQAAGFFSKNWDLENNDYYIKPE